MGNTHEIILPIKKKEKLNYYHCPYCGTVFSDERHMACVVCPICDDSAKQADRISHLMFWFVKGWRVGNWNWDEE